MDKIAENTTNISARSEAMEGEQDTIKKGSVQTDQSWVKISCLEPCRISPFEEKPKVSSISFCNQYI